MVQHTMAANIGEGIPNSKLDRPSPRGTMRHAFAFAFLFALAGCDSTTLVVESDTAWDGGIFGPGGSQFVEGNGPARYPLAPGRHCWVFEATGPGTLRVYAERASMTAPERIGEGAASQPGEDIRGCT